MQIILKEFSSNISSSEFQAKERVIQYRKTREDIINRAKAAGHTVDYKNFIDKNGVFMTKYHQIDCYEDFFMSDNKVWCTAWSRIIKKNKIIYFPEDSLMEDRTWSYEQADNVDFNKIVNVKEPLYTWNRTNITNSVSIVRNKIWEASAWKHVGQQLMLIERLKHKEMIPILKERIEVCKRKVNSNIYQQY